MERTQAFFFGFAMAGLIGWLASLLLGSWVSIGKIYKRIFISVPKPALKPTTLDANCKCVGTDPNQSPLQVVSQGCLNILVQWLLQGIVLIAIVVALWFSLQWEVTQEFLAGVVFAAVMGFLLQNIRKNWKRIANLSKVISKPPSASLNNINHPNNAYVAATLALPPPLSYPPLPPIDVLIKGSLEIGWRLIWQIVLLAALYLAFQEAYRFLTG